MKHWTRFKFCSLCCAHNLLCSKASHAVLNSAVLHCHHHEISYAIATSPTALAPPAVLHCVVLPGITRQLFLDDQAHFVGDFLAYDEQEFVQSWPLPEDVRQRLNAKLGGTAAAAAAAAAACEKHVSITADSTAELQACQ